MRNRTATFLLLACLLGGLGYFGGNRSRCGASTWATLPGSADETEDASTPCLPSGVDAPSPAWTYGADVLALIFFAAGCYSGIQAYQARRTERDLLRGAGIDVDERDLPLDV